MVMNSTGCCYFFFGHENFFGNEVTLLEETPKILSTYLTNDLPHLSDPIFSPQIYMTYWVSRCGCS